MLWISPFFSESELGPEDYLLHKVHSILQGDSKLQAIIGKEWIRAYSVYAPIDWDRFPQLSIAPYMLTQAPVVGSFRETIQIYIVARFEILSIKPAAPWTAGLSTFWRHINRLLRASGNLQLHHIVNGREIQLALRSDAGEIINEPEADPTASRFAYRSVLRWDYDVRVDVATQRIRNVVLAEGA